MPDNELKPCVDVLRLWTSHQYGTFSAIFINQAWFCIGLEPYDYGNTPEQSCIPEGQYQCRRVPSDLVSGITHNLIVTTFEATYVPKRSLIRFHPGNTKKHTLGCILLGDKIDKLGDTNHAVLNSGETFKRFMAMLDGYDEFVLTISSNY